MATTRFSNWESLYEFINISSGITRFFGSELEVKEGLVKCTIPYAIVYTLLVYMYYIVLHTIYPNYIYYSILHYKIICGLDLERGNRTIKTCSYFGIY